MNVESILKKVEAAFDANKDDPSIEVEMRLGKFNGSMFDTNVGKEVFERLLHGLEQYDGWQDVKTSSSEVFYRERDSVRMTIDDETGDQTIIQKRSMFKEDIKKVKNAPFDNASFAAPSSPDFRCRDSSGNKTMPTAIPTTPRGN